MLLQFKRDCYILGIWFAQRYYLGRVFIYAFKENKKTSWVGKIKYIYHDEGININHDEDHPNNAFQYDGISDELMMKRCQEKIDELYCTFNHEKDKLIVKGDFERLIEVSKDKKWVPYLKEVPNK